VDYDVVVMDADTDEVASNNPQGLRESAHLGLFGNVDCVERVMAPGESAHLDHQRSGLVLGHYVDFTAADADISGEDREAMADEDDASDAFPDFTNRVAG
jgi:hypothetical protein